MTPPRHSPRGSGPGRGAGGEAERRGFLLRLPAPLLEDLRAWAAREVRSLNGHIEYLLREAVRRRRGGPPRPD